MGYSRAGFDEIVGVDIKPQPRYPFQFVQADALDFVRSFGAGFDAIHASPPCQAYSSTRTLNKTGARHVKLIPAVRLALQGSGRPWVIENVGRSDLQRPHVLDGRDFGLGIGIYGLKRERWFELWEAIPILLPQRDRPRALVNVIGGRLRIMPDAPGRERTNHRLPACELPAGPTTELGQAQIAMGCALPLADLSQAVPPAYTEYIGRQLLAALTEERRIAG